MTSIRERRSRGGDAAKTFRNANYRVDAAISDAACAVFLVVNIASGLGLGLFGVAVQIALLLTGVWTTTRWWRVTLVVDRQGVTVNNRAESFRLSWREIDHFELQNYGRAVLETGTPVRIEAVQELEGMFLWMAAFAVGATKAEHVIEGVEVLRQRWTSRRASDDERGSI